MRQVNIRTLRLELSTQLEDLPFEITKNGQVIAIACTQQTKTTNNSVHNGNIDDKPEKVTIQNNTENFRPYQKATQVGKK